MNILCEKVKKNIPKIKKNTKKRYYSRYNRYNSSSKAVGENIGGKFFNLKRIRKAYQHSVAASFALLCRHEYKVGCGLDLRMRI